MPATVRERFASLEIVAGAYKLVLARLLPFQCRIKLYQSYVNNLSEAAFDIYGGRIVETLWFSKGTSRRFKNGEKELGVVLRYIPRLKKYQGVLREHINVQRRKYGLKT